MRTPGRVSVEPRAIRTVVEAVAAEAFQTSTKRVSAKVHADGPRLEVDVTTPYGGTEPLLGAAASGRDRVRTRAGEITGATLHAVRVRVTGFARQETRRVA